MDQKRINGINENWQLIKVKLSEFSSRIRDILYTKLPSEGIERLMISARRHFYTLKRERVWTLGTKFSLRGRGCNTPAFRTKRGSLRVVHCIHASEKSGEILCKIKRNVGGSRSLLCWRQRQNKCSGFRHDLYCYFEFEGITFEFELNLIQT